jgi:hypothetical protein
MRPKKWVMDIPSRGSAVTGQEVSLDILSHIAPGFTTIYEQSFDVISEGGRIYQIYPVDPAGVFHDLNLWHPSIFGLDLGMQSGTGYVVNAFELIASDARFLEKASSLLGIGKLVMPSADHSGIISSAVSYPNIGADALDVVAIDAPMPEELMRSNDITALLPLHVTMNIPYSNRLIAPVWEELWNEWNIGGSQALKEVFGDYFGLYIRDANSKNLDLTKWLRDKGLYNKLVKVFMDDEKSIVTVSFIAMIADGHSTGVSTVRDVSLLADREYMVVKDGLRDDKWSLVFMLAPKDYVLSDAGGDGGASCGAGAAVPLLLALLPLFRVAVSRTKR